MSLRFVLFGHPVAHSLSPAIHHAAYRALGLPHRYELMDVADEAALKLGVEQVRSGAIAGANVTVPWKREALALADRADERARAVGAANVLVREEGEVVAYNSDVPALAQEIARRVAAPSSVLVLGNGGAALAAVAAANSLRARRVCVSARSFSSELAESAWPHAEEFRALGAEVIAWPTNSPAARETPFAEACRSAHVILQATSAGMHGKGGGAELARVIPWKELEHCELAYDLVYNPPDTEFLRAAAAHSINHAHGLGMLVGQAALAIEYWLGVNPPRPALAAAAEAALLARRQG